MGRKKIGIAQVRFDFAITPKTEHDQYVVEALQRLKDTNELSAFLRSLVYPALPMPGHQVTPAEQPAMPAKASLASNGNGWTGKPVPKPK